MKLKYFIPAFIALIGALLVSCSDEDTMTLLNEIQVSRSYVPISIDGGEASIDIKTTDSWSIDTTQVPKWLTITPVNGGAGEGKITFSAPAAPDGRNAEVIIECAGRQQHIKVIQGLASVQEATCAEVQTGPVGKTYRVTGTVTKYVGNYETYGNLYIEDETGELYIYGMADKNGKLGNKPLQSWGIEIGDIITVEGPKEIYKGTVELVDVTVLKVVKSLIKIESYDPEDATIPQEGGNVTVNLSCKGNGVTVEIPEEAKSWLHITSITGGSKPTVTFHANANSGEFRTTDVTFKTSDGNQDSETTATIIQAGAIEEVTCAEFLEKEESDKPYLITAVIQKVVNSDYGNVYLRDWTNQEVYVYGIGAQGDFTTLGLKEGDIVTLVGKRSSYNGSPQMKYAQYKTHIPVTDIEIADLLTKTPDDNTYYRITGTIETIDNPTFGNVYMSDDGGETYVYVYGVYPGWGATGDNRKNWFATAGIEAGDELTTIGYWHEHNGKLELSGGIYFSHRKQ